MSHKENDIYDCIGGEGWYHVSAFCQLPRLFITNRRDAPKTSQYTFQNGCFRIFLLCQLLSEMMLRSDQVMTNNYDYQKMIEKNVGFGNFWISVLDYENIKNFTLRASSGIVGQRHDSKYELSTFQVRIFTFAIDFHIQELSMLVHVSTSYEEAFIRRNAVLKFQQRYLSFLSISFWITCSILRSAQMHRASLKPAYPGSVSFCTCGYVVFIEIK